LRSTRFTPASLARASNPSPPKPVAMMIGTPGLSRRSSTASPVPVSPGILSSLITAS